MSNYMDRFLDYLESTTPEERLRPASDSAFPFPLAEPKPEPVMVTRPCGCTSMITEPGERPMQVSWCVGHDPGYDTRKG